MRFMSTGMLFFALAALSAPGASSRAATEPPAAPATATAAPIPPSPTRWEKAIAAFEEKDRQAPPPKGAILFIGSSSIVKWKSLAQDFPDVPVLNRGFGGSYLADSTFYADRIVVPYQPRRIVLFAGDNDIAGGIAPETVAADFAAFVTKVRAALPDVPIVYISIKPSPSRWKVHEKDETANRLIQNYCAQVKGLSFVDVYHAMLSADGKSRPELFGPDRLHMNPKGYAIWTQLLTPYVR